MDEFDLYGDSEGSAARANPEFTESSFIPEEDIPVIAPEQERIEENNATEGMLSYADHIQPLKKQYFQATFGSGMRSDLARKQFAGRAKEADEMFNSEMQSRSYEMNIRRNDVAYDTAVHNLTRAREEAARDREMAASMQPIQEELSAIMNDPTLSREEATRMVGALGVRHGDVLARNKGANAAFTSASRALLGYDDAKKPGVSFGTMFNRSPEIAGQAARLFAEQYGREPSDQDRMPIEVAGALSNYRTQQELKQKYNLELTKEQRDLAYKQQSNLFKAVEDSDFLKDGETGEIDRTKFSEPQQQEQVRVFIEQYGLPEEKAAAEAASGNAEALLGVAGTILGGIRAGQRSAVPAPMRPPVRREPADAAYFK